MSSTSRTMFGRIATSLATAGICAALTTAPAWADDSEAGAPGSAQLYGQVQQFEGWMVGDLDHQWTAWFQAHQTSTGQPLQFTAPDVQIVNPGMQVQTACGPLASDTPNAFYCQGDNTIWLPLDSMVTMMQSGRFGDVDDPQLTNFDISTIIAHEYGHYVQNELEQDGVYVRTPLSVNNDVGVEDFADCAAGYWAATAANSGYLDTGDLDSGVRMLEEMGEIAPTPGEADPHGAPQERRDAFGLGYTQGADRCASVYLGTPTSA
jgi:predicted metalloprotease